MKIWITCIKRNSKKRCEFCGLPIEGYSFGLDGYAHMGEPDLFDAFFEKQGILALLGRPHVGAWIEIVALNILL